MHTLNLTKKLFIDQGTCILYVFFYTYLFTNTVHILFLSLPECFFSYSKDELDRFASHLQKAVSTQNNLGFLVPSGVHQEGVESRFQFFPWEKNLQRLPSWWFQTFFIFNPTWGNDPIWRSYFSNGLVQPPTSFDLAFVSQKQCLSIEVGDKNHMPRLDVLQHVPGCN